jgi:hypothetical protein
MSSPASMGSVHRLPPRAVAGLLILPLLMAFAYPILFLAAFHDPAPRNMDLAVVESTDQASGLAAQLESSADDDALDVTTVPDVATAKNDVLHLDTRAAYDPKTGDLYLASASSVAATNAAQQVFQKVAKQSDQELTVHDLQAPTDKDPQATAFMYLAIIAVLAGFMTALMVNISGKHLSPWKKLLVLCGMGIATATIAVTVTFHFYGVYDTHIVQSGLVYLGTFLAVATFMAGLTSIVGQAGSFFAIVFFILLGIPSAGAAMPVDMLPGFFRVMHYVLPPGISSDMQRSTLYFHGHGISSSIPVLMVWFFAGLALLWVGTLKNPKEQPAATDEATDRPTGRRAPSRRPAAAVPPRSPPTQRLHRTPDMTTTNSPEDPRQRPRDAAAPGDDGHTWAIPALSGSSAYSPGSAYPAPTSASRGAGQVPTASAPRGPRSASAADAGTTRRRRANPFARLGSVKAASGIGAMQDPTKPAPENPVPPKLKARRMLTITLLFPLFVATVMPLLMTGIMAGVTPRHMDVAVVGTGSEVSDLAKQLDEQAGNTFDVTRYANLDDAEDKIADQDLRAAYVPENGKMYITGANGVRVTQAVTAFFTPVAQQDGKSLETKDLIPFTDDDQTGITAMFLTLGALIGGFMAGMLLGMMPVASKLRIALGIAVPAVIALGEVILGWIAFGVFDDNAIVPFCMLFLLSASCMAIMMGGMLTIGPVMLPLGMVLCPLLGLATSGVMAPLDMINGFYSGVHPWLFSSQGASAVRDSIYFDDVSLVQPVLVMLAWLVGGALLAVIGTVRQKRRHLFAEMSDVEKVETAVGAMAVAP